MTQYAIVRWSFYMICWIVLSSSLHADDIAKGHGPKATEMEFVAIPSGKFTMGFSINNPSERQGLDKIVASKNETPRHDVTISQPMLVGKYEVTIRQILEWLNSPDVEFSDNWVALKEKECPIQQVDNVFAQNKESKFSKTLDQPMVCISWEGATAFCEWCTKQDPNFIYRLPTEAEWEYFARAGSSTNFPWGPSYNGAEANINGSKVFTSNKTGPNNAVTVPVGSYRANEWGVHDTVGNVAEYCSDWYDDSYYARSPQADPPGPKSGKTRVARGGSWKAIDVFCTSSYRMGWSLPSSATDYIGFRVVAEQRK